MSENDDGRMSFEQAVDFVRRHRDKVAFAAMPVFGELSDDAEQRAEGVRVFVIEADADAGYRLRFVAGPFFANVHGANEIIAADAIPASVRGLRFLPSVFDPAWLDGQIQVLVQKLVQSSTVAAPQMPDYEHVAEPEQAVFPVSFVGRDH